MAGKILVLSEPFGLGHERAAQALIKCIKTKDPRIDILHTTGIKCNFPRLTDYVLKLYLQVIKTFPHIWHKFYQQSRENKNPDSKQAVYRLLAAGIKKTICDFRPDAVVCTHPFPASVVSRLKNDGLDVPLIGIITDYDIHAYWLDRNIDLYIIGDGILEKDFTTLGFEPRRVSSGGIPIDPVFEEKRDQEELKSRLGLDKHQPLALLAGGGWGLGDLNRIAGMLASMPAKPQVVAIAGINSQLKGLLQQSYAGIRNVKVQGLVQNIDEYMKAADILVTKPGGLTISEGLAAGVPMVLFDVLYGQEVWNAGFLTGRGAAVKCGHIDEIPLKVQRLLEDAKARRQLSEQALVLGKPRSGIDAAANVIAIAGL
jgi:processive 1,2-diacylglycerol beta-glucosyltransferase